MPDDPAFVRMIAAAPDDDAPRLVYADVLEERGDPASAARAEFIRVQCERARLVPDSPRWRELWFRDTALLDWARQWRAELPVIEGVQYGGFVRGFIDQVNAATDAAAGYLGRLLQHLPLRQLSLTVVSAPAMRRLVRVRELADVPEVAFVGYHAMSLDALRALATRGPWPRLRRLHVPTLGYFDPEQRGREWMEVRDALRAAFGDRLTA
jgi:uncharacterized protein (TIGR02996 family)